MKGVDVGGLSPASLDAARGPEGKLYGVPFAVHMQSIKKLAELFAKHVGEFPAYGANTRWKMLAYNMSRAWLPTIANKQRLILHIA